MFTSPLKYQEDFVSGKTVAGIMLFSTRKLLREFCDLDKSKVEALEQILESRSGDMLASDGLRSLIKLSGYLHLRNLHLRLVEDGGMCLPEFAEKVARYRKIYHSYLNFLLKLALKTKYTEEGCFGFDERYAEEELAVLPLSELDTLHRRAEFFQSLVQNKEERIKERLMIVKSHIQNVKKILDGIPEDYCYCPHEPHNEDSYVTIWYYGPFAPLYILAEYCRCRELTEEAKVTVIREIAKDVRRFISQVNSVGGMLTYGEEDEARITPEMKEFLDSLRR
ncbi:hypothetical protein DRJ16_00870 [Candidatus Woesearchaeota archaeon]|nr:MAG: hypothetical protein DRJ16_00870 [Candidatus Woesearchaeota archaeon]